MLVNGMFPNLHNKGTPTISHNAHCKVQISLEQKYLVFGYNIFHVVVAQLAANIRIRNGEQPLCVETVLEA